MAGISSGEGLAVDSSNSVYISKTGTNSIQKFTSAGVGSTFVTFAGASPFAMAFQRSSVPEPVGIALGAIGVATAVLMIRKPRRSRK